MRLRSRTLIMERQLAQIDLLYSVHPKGKPDSKPNRIQIKKSPPHPSFLVPCSRTLRESQEPRQHHHQSQAAPTGEIPTCRDPSPAARCSTHPIATRFHSLVYPESRDFDDLLLPLFFVSPSLFYFHLDFNATQDKPRTPLSSNSRLTLYPME